VRSFPRAPYQDALHDKRIMPGRKIRSLPTNRSRIPPRRIIQIQSIKLANTESANDKVVAVVVSICDSESYDALFTTIPQEGAAGTRVAVYRATSNSLSAILRAFNRDPLPSPDQELAAMVRQVMADIELVDNDCVVFNWECCGGCSDEGFCEHHQHSASQTTLELMECLIARGSMVMCSDFSLKALIKDWRPDLLGPNPFLQLGTFHRSFKLYFDPATLAQCSSSQLQKVGELCGQGHAVVGAMPDTIAFTVDQSKTQHNAYKVQVLTVVTDMSGFDLDERLPHDKRCQINNHYGAAGHVLLTYPSGGHLLVSAGHWLELSNLDVSIENLRVLAAREYGAEYTSQLVMDLSDERDSAEERSTKMQYWGKRMLTSSAPCSKRVSTKYSSG